MTEDPAGPDPAEEAPSEPTVRHGTCEGTVWPIPSPADPDRNGPEWVLRYGSLLAREDQKYGVASIVAAYSALVDPSISQKQAIEMLKRARSVQRG